MNEQIDPSGFPTPVAIPLRQYLDARSDEERLLAGADAGYALVKFVAFVRLADWIREDTPLTPGLEDPKHLRRSMTGAMAEDWWQISMALDEAVARSLAPDTPGWSDPRLERHLQQLNRARRSRHWISKPQDHPREAAEVGHAIDALVTASAPIWTGVLERRQGNRIEPCMGSALPKVETGEWRISMRYPGREPLDLTPFALMIAPDRDAQRDLYVYERLTHRGAIYELHPTLFESTPTPSGLMRLQQWVKDQVERRRKSSGEQLDRLEPEALLERLESGWRYLTEKEWRIENALKYPANRPEVERALGRLARSGVGFLCLSGPSGIGKTFELVRWLKGQQADATPRVRIWIPAASWVGESFESIVGSQANQGRPAGISMTRLLEVAADRGLAIAVDGINEARDPDGLARLVVDAVTRLSNGGGPSVQLVVSCRPDNVDRVVSNIPTAWRTQVEMGKEGVMVLHPLPNREAARLWDAGIQETMTPRFDTLPSSVQRLLCVPILSSLARDARFEGDDLRDAAGIIERFIGTQTSSLQRLILRHLALGMFTRGRQVLAPTDFEELDDASEIMRAAFRMEDDAWGEAFASLLSQGLLILHGTFPEEEDSGVAFAHDRILQWFIASWLARFAADPIRTGEFARLIEPVMGSTALASAVGEAFARVHREANPETRKRMESMLLKSLSEGSSSDPSIEDLVGVRHAVRAWGEGDTETLGRWMSLAWRQSRWRSNARIELVSLAADVNHVPVLADGLGSWKSVREATVSVLSRVRLHSPEMVRQALERRWNRISHPMLHPIDTVTLLVALLYGAVAEGGMAEPDDQLVTMARTVTRDLLGSGNSRTSRAMKSLVVRFLVGGINPFLDFFPQGPINQTRELRAFLRSTSPRDRKKYLPLLRVFAGETRVREIEPLAFRVACEGSWLPTVLLERSLMVASDSEEDCDDALEIALESGRLAQAASGFVPMAAEGMLYVLSEYLRFHVNLISLPQWDRRYDQFKRLSRGWLERATDRRWDSPLTKKRYKALYATAHALLWQVRFGDTPCEEIRALWDRYFSKRDRGLAMDLVDDLEILAMNEGGWGRTLLELEPFLAKDDADDAVIKRISQLVGAIGERDAAAVTARLDSHLPGRNRESVSRRMHIGRTRATLGNAFFQGFDRGLVLNPRFRPTVLALMTELLESPSRLSWFEFAIRRVASDLAGSEVFET